MSESLPDSNGVSPAPPRPAWRRLWSDFITSGDRVTPDDPDYLRVTLLNLVEGASLIVWVLFLGLGLTGVLERSLARVAIDMTGIVVAAAVLVSLRRGARVPVVAEIVHGVLFVLLLSIAVVRMHNPLAMAVPLIYPAIAFLLLDNVRRASLWTLGMVACLNLTILLQTRSYLADWSLVVDGALSLSVAMFFQAAVMALYLHNRIAVISRLRAVSAKLSYTATHDALTGLYDRHTFMETLRRELARRDRRLFAFLIFDIDRFKAYNDAFGHPQGDRLIQRIAGAAQSVFGRREDVVFRLGGEEFGVLFRAESEKEAATMADRLLAAVEALGEPAPAGPRASITVSAGLLLRRGGGELTPEAVYRGADDALYDAKEGGRARWAIARPTICSSKDERDIFAARSGQGTAKR